MAWVMETAFTVSGPTVAEIAPCLVMPNLSPSIQILGRGRGREQNRDRCGYERGQGRSPKNFRSIGLLPIAHHASPRRFLILTECLAGKQTGARSRRLRLI
jgi:hypothetical protein